jgi:glycosyltransferase involved in cell wall biosynthesis
VTLNKPTYRPIEILLATFNGEQMIKPQLDSLLRQTHQDWLLLAHDDGSTDSTPAILKEYESRYPEKFFLFDDGVRTGGAKNNFAHLMSKSTAPYVMFCDQDDIWFPDKIESTLALMKEIESACPGRPVLVHTNLEVVDARLNTISKSMFQTHRISMAPDLRELLIRNNVAGCTMMINRVALQTSLPMPDEALMHDWWVALKVLSNDGRIGFIEKPTMYYRQHGSNVSGAVKMNLRKHFFEALSPRDLYQDWKAVLLQARSIKRISMLNLLTMKIRLFLRKRIRSAPRDSVS